MSGGRKIGAGRAHAEEPLSHDQRPWVFFMVDCFMLITEFFVLSFKFKTEEVVLPHKLPPGGGGGGLVLHERTLSVHVMGVGGVPVYRIMQKQLPFAEFADTLAGVASADTRFTVRVSYERLVPFEHVMAVFNECSKVRIKQVGLVPFHGDSD